MTLSSKQIGDIANLYESITAFEQEQLDEDLIGDIISNRGKIKSAATKAASATGKALSATNKAIGGTVSNAVRGASSTAKDVAKGFQYGGSTGAAAVLGGRIAQGIMNAGKKPSVPVTPDSKRDPEFRRGAGAGAGDMNAGKPEKPVPPTPTPARPAAAAPARPAAAAPAKVVPSKPAGSAMDQWRAANPKLAAAADEKARIRGTQQTDNPLMKDMRSRLPMKSPSVQAPAVAKLGAGNQSLTQNPNAFKAAPEVKKTAAIAATPKPAPVAPAKTPIASGYEYDDAYDLVLEYLFDNGHVDTVEEAHYIMMELDAEVIQDIVEEVLNEDAKYDRNRKRAAQRAAARNAARDAGQTGAVPGVGYVTPRRERETYTDSAGVERHKTGAKMPKKD